MVVISIIGVMAGMAIPIFTNAMENGRKNEAIANLNAIYIGEKIFYQNNSRQYWPLGAPVRTPGSLASINTNLGVDLIPRDFWYCVSYTPSATPALRSFRAWAVRTNAANSPQLCIDQTGTLSDPCTQGLVC